MQSAWESGLAALATQTARPDPVADISGPDASEIWAGFDLDRQRQVFALLATVTLQRGRLGRPRGSTRREYGTYGTYFDDGSVQLAWK
jgi:hypothetical protein